VKPTAIAIDTNAMLAASKKWLEDYKLTNELLSVITL
jgi:hypothetical protein